MIEETHSKLQPLYGAGRGSQMGIDVQFLLDLLRIHRDEKSGQFVLSEFSDASIIHAERFSR
jgi:hypothetical protein